MSIASAKVSLWLWLLLLAAGAHLVSAVSSFVAGLLFSLGRDNVHGRLTAAIAEGSVLPSRFSRPMASVASTDPAEVARAYLGYGSDTFVHYSIASTIMSLVAVLFGLAAVVIGWGLWRSRKANPEESPQPERLVDQTGR